MREKCYTGSIAKKAESTRRGYLLRIALNQIVFYIINKFAEPDSSGIDASIVTYRYKYKTNGSLRSA